MDRTGIIVRGLALLLLCANAFLAFQSGWPTFFSGLSTLLWLPLMSGLFWVALRKGKPIAAAVVFVFSLAYSPGLGSALSVGTSINVGVGASQGSVLTALLLLTTFLAIVVVASCIVPVTRAPSEESEAPTYIATLALTAVAGLGALRDGSWSYYLSERGEAVLGDIRVSALYLPALFSSFVLMARRTVRSGSLISYGLLSAVGIALWLVQNRRLLIGACVVSLLVVMLSRPKLGRMLRFSAFVGVFAVVGFSASTAARSARLIDGPTSDVSLAGDLGSPSLLSKQISTRALYLATDAVTVETSEVHRIEPYLLDAFYVCLARATPGILFPHKYDLQDKTCELIYYSSDRQFLDLSCTPITEGYASDQWLGVLLVALVFGLAAAFGDWLIGRGRAITLVGGAALATQLVMIESEAFPIFQALRSCFSVMVPAFVLSTILGKLLPRRLLLLLD